MIIDKLLGELEGLAEDYSFPRLAEIAQEFKAELKAHQASLALAERAPQATDSSLGSAGSPR